MEVIEDIMSVSSDDGLQWSIKKIENVYQVYVLVYDKLIKIEYSGTVEQCITYIEEKIK